MQELIQEWGLDTGLQSKEAIIDALRAKLDRLLRDDPMGLIQLMYRLDIPEDRLDAALDSEASASLIAHLVWNRQEQKQLMRATMQRPAPEADDELAW
jgi:ABC-type taurine transport system ATPase subunit